jgi:peptidoglycan/xylan/chitin deacetylase (PgdA/CDA1 family)
MWAGLLSACGGTVGTVLRSVPTGNARILDTPPATAKPSPLAARPASITRAPAAGPVHPADQAPAVEIVHGSREGNEVALTFQGAGDPRLARALLHEAERAHVRVTVLALGNWLEAHPFIAHRILRGGHELGNNSYSHPQMLRLSAEETYEEITHCANVLRKLTGSQGVWFRPTGTARANSTILEAAGRAGYERVLEYDVSTYDVTDPGANRIVESADGGIRPGSIVSLHLGHRGTVAALPVILEHLKAKGLTAVSASDLLKHA